MTSQIDFAFYLRTSAHAIEKELNIFSKSWNKQIASSFPQLQTLNRRFTDSFFGGKMLRGTLVQFGYELVQTKSSAEIFKPAAAFEILHTSLMTHDDIIDQSPTRRGKTAIHIHTDKHFGISQAICLGDLGISLAVKLLSECNFQTERKNNAVNYFSQIITDTILGEMLDVESPHTSLTTEEQILTIHKMKTARYTIVGPLTIGAMLGGADDKLLNNIKRFGEHLGIAYQIQDDILGIYGDETTIGKSTTSDIEENKSTLLLVNSLEHGTKQQKEILKKYYGKKGIAKEEQEMIKKIFTETGALAYSQDKIIKLITKAKKLIPLLSKDETKQELLTQLTDALVNRKN